MTEAEDKISQNIEKNGCHIIHHDGDQTKPSVTYSVGMKASAQCPDILVTGMEKDMAHFLINEYLYRIRDRENFVADQSYSDFLEDALITFKAIDKGHYHNFCPQAVSFYGDDGFEMLHLIWPDFDGIWPWEKKASKDYRFLMPRLYQK